MAPTNKENKTRSRRISETNYNVDSEEYRKKRDKNNLVGTGEERLDLTYYLYRDTTQKNFFS